VRACEFPSLMCALCRFVMTELFLLVMCMQDVHFRGMDLKDTPAPLDYH
jgi:hypothetical protein